MFFRLFHTLTNPESFWREILKYGYFYKRKFPEDWFLFRHDVARECAMRRDVQAGPARKYMEEIFPAAVKSRCRIEPVRPNAYNSSWEEIVMISQLVASASPKKIFEFGTFDGRTTLHLALNSPDDAVIYTIDIKEGHFNFGGDSQFFKQTRVGNCFLESSLKEKIIMLTGDSKKFDFTRYNNDIDFIFIDGDHSYDGVMNDSEKAFQLVRPGGLIVWHDYLLIGDVSRAIVDISNSRDLINLKGTSLVIWQRPPE